jgi:hypothetical protein
LADIEGILEMNAFGKTLTDWIKRSIC